jgi:hypothetical protein
MLTLLSSCENAHGLIHSKFSKYIPIESPPAPLRIWLEQLRYSGIDLRRYGRKEKSLWEDPRVNREWAYPEVGKRDQWTGNWRRIRLINFIYGPEPGDWRFWIEPVIPNFFMQFWEMVDHPERAMPGAWEEDCSAYDRTTMITTVMNLMMTNYNESTGEERKSNSCKRNLPLHYIFF